MWYWVRRSRAINFKTTPINVMLIQARPSYIYSVSQLGRRYLQSGYFLVSFEPCIERCHDIEMIYFQMLRSVIHWIWTNPRHIRDLGNKRQVFACTMFILVSIFRAYDNVLYERSQSETSIGNFYFFFCYQGGIKGLHEEAGSFPNAKSESANVLMLELRLRFLYNRLALFIHCDSHLSSMALPWQHLSVINVVSFY